MSKFLENWKIIEDSKKEIETLEAKLNFAKKEIENILGMTFNTFGLKILINNSLYNAMSLSEKEVLNNERKMRETSSVWFKGHFDPDLDKYEILKVEYNEDKTKVKIFVDNIANRQFLGLAGCWIPEIHETEWIDLKDIEKAEKITLFNFDIENE